MKNVDVVVHVVDHELGLVGALQGILKHYEGGYTHRIAEHIVGGESTVELANNWQAMCEYVVLAFVDGEGLVEDSEKQDILDGLEGIWARQETVDIVGEELVGEKYLYTYNTHSYNVAE
jgi:hypothetical protein